MQLVPTPGHAGADALVGLPDLVPLVVVRGSGEVTRRLSALGAAAGTRVLAHADGGGVLYLDASADEKAVARMVHDSTDRLGVCNRLNLLLIDRPAHDRLWPVAEAALRERDLTPSLPPHSHRLGHEWALDAGNEAHVTVAEVDGPARRRPHRRPRDVGPGRGRLRGGREGGDGVHRRLHGHRRVLERPDPPARRLQAAGAARDRDQRRPHPGPPRARDVPGPLAAPVRGAAAGLTPVGCPRRVSVRAVRVGVVPDLHRATLSNGLRVLLAPDPNTPVVGVAVHVDVGFRSEPEGRTGFAHLFEHLMFQGSESLEKLAHFRHVQGSGGVFNGSTHQDYTDYFEVLPAAALERALFLEADRLRAPKLTVRTCATRSTSSRRRSGSTS